MTTAFKGCVVCGNSETVRSHLFPRALVKRIRGDAKNLVDGDRNRPGIKISQNGIWDDGFVCERHEQALATADDYIARFCRKFEEASRLSPSGKSYKVANPRPDLLLRFAAATVWRFAVSKHGNDHGLKLGPYKQLIEQHLFGSAVFPLEVLVGRSNVIDPSGKHVEIGLAPYKSKLLDWTVWHFSIGGFDFYLKADKRPFPKEWMEFLANDNDPITLPMIDPVRIHELEKFQPIFAQMLKRRLR